MRHVVRGLWQLRSARCSHSGGFRNRTLGESDLAGAPIARDSDETVRGLDASCHDITCVDELDRFLIHLLRSFADDGEALAEGHGRDARVGGLSLSATNCCRAEGASQDYHQKGAHQPILQRPEDHHTRALPAVLYRTGKERAAAWGRSSPSMSQGMSAGCDGSYPAAVSRD